MSKRMGGATGKVVGGHPGGGGQVADMARGLLWLCGVFLRGVCSCARGKGRRVSVIDARQLLFAAAKLAARVTRLVGLCRGGWKWEG